MNLVLKSLPRRLGLTVLGAAIVSLAASAALADPAPAFAAFAMEWAVQDVCLDAAGRVIANASPLSSACATIRSLRPGERLPYHKHDWPSARWGQPDPRGMQRSDSFPSTLGDARVAVQTFDFGPSTRRRFAAFDAGDGGQVVGVSGDTAAILLTQDHAEQIKFFFGPDCRRAASLESLQRGWILFDIGAARGEAGHRVARLIQAYDNQSCPLIRASAFTEWRFADIAYRGTLGGDLTRPLRTLVTDHYSGPSPTGAGAMERMYLTRELGWTRWEAWKRPRLGGLSSDAIEARAEAVIAAHRCDQRYPGPPAADGWRLVDCREWTNIQPAAGPDGDLPEFWIDRLNAQGLFH